MTEILDTLSLEGLRFTTVKLHESDHVFTITLDRVQRKNAINAEMTNELIYALDYAKQRRSIRVVVLAAEGDVFCAGGDLRSMRGEPEAGEVSNVPARGGVDDISLRIYHLNKPLIAQIQGSVLAGALLMVCNATHAIAADHAEFSAPEIKRGIWPCMVMAGLFRVMPKRAGLDFIMRGEAMNAHQAAHYGLINEAVPAKDLQARVAELAQQMARLAPGTMQMGLAAYNQQSEMSFDAALPYLRKQIDACLESADAKEGIAAFLEKREPKWD
ncbi:enoyl-CoA hydratase-related protein [Rhodobacteraceae bacterium D3-12]|nr:enoyl-CoA hydratase-related protein [Rhodobacteraceae bacterium D3-12]